MSRGGYRPGAGRKKGSKKTKESSVFLSKAGEFAKFYKGLLDRSSQGKKPTDSEKQTMNKLASELTKNYEPGGENKPVNISTADAKTYLEELLISVWVDQKSKIQIANILMPYQHTRKGEGAGKKEEKADRAASAGKGRYQTGRPPIKLVK